MAEFIERMMGGRKPSGKKNITNITNKIEEVPELANALMVVLYHVMNNPEKPGSGVREVGDTCTIMMPDVEVTALNPDTGKTHDFKAGTYSVTVERVS